MKTILIWGFYNLGNIGDDLMGMIIYEMIEELGSKPIIFSANPRFASMGYRTTKSFDGLAPDAIVLGGGAFFKNAAVSNSSIEDQIAMLGHFVNEKAIPIHGISLGSDGVDTIDAISPARRSVVQGGHFQSAVLRLVSDLELGLPSAVHLPDIVLLASFCCARYPRLQVIEPCEAPYRTLINLSRRSVARLPGILWRARRARAAFFCAHTSVGNTGGEITLPSLPVIANYSIAAQLGHLKAAQRIVSSKLHPGVISLSFGNEFEAISPRPKTVRFLNETQLSSVVFPRIFDKYMAKILACLS